MYNIPAFNLRFPLADLDKWAGQYFATQNMAKEQAVQSVADAAARRGFMEREEFLQVVDWKSARRRKAAADNTQDEIKNATRSAFATTDARVRMGVLTTLSGVGYPMASAILHLVCKDAPLMDVWALCAFGVKVPSSYRFPFWVAYSSAVSELQKKCAKPLRTIDQALWSYGEAHRIIT